MLELDLIHVSKRGYWASVSPFDYEIGLFLSLVIDDFYFNFWTFNIRDIFLQINDPFSFKLLLIML